MSNSSSSETQASNPKSKRLLLLVFSGCLLIGAGEGARRWLLPPIDEVTAISPHSRLIESEGLILDLTPRLKEFLSTSVLNLQLPDALGVELFAKQVSIRDVAFDLPIDIKELPGLNSRKLSWKVSSTSTSVSADECSLWNPLFESVAGITYFERAGFKFVNSHFDEADAGLLHSDVTFEGLARDNDGRFILVKAEQSLSWRADPSSTVATQDASDQGSAATSVTSAKSNVPAAELWKIVEWTQTSFEMVMAERSFFAESLNQVIPDPQLRTRLRNSLHEQYILDRFAALSKREQWEGPHPYFSVVSQDRHPSLSVVDIDGDGLDDIYVMARWGKNILLHNKGGYFEDVAGQYGLDIDSHCSSAIFADFDNDGDVDLMLGRTLVPSQYMANEDGHFVDRSDTLVEGNLPALVTSVSAADYNGDGLLDVYLSTYAANMQEDEVRDQGPELNNPEAIGLLSDFLPEATSVALQSKLAQRGYHRHLNNYGPPNLLLVNRGGRFETSPQNDQVAIWRHTYQASWSDFDRDGDQDLYLANDFAVNSLMRNDGDKGFVDVAAETGTADIGFGMGASWGDYNNDGRADLYVSNMFSKAGRRITGSLKNIDDRFAMMARGNSLFQNGASGFNKVSGLEAPALQV
ncbi:MAG: VCBS repeat-containing protein, partial [Planctomycetota bacterium]|nr:VCBS repeat-containing protein [Planctomycetota bacterium]